MKRTTPILMLVLMLLLTAWMMPATAEENPTLLTLYEGPKTMTTSATAKVTANGNDLFVYDVMVNHEHIWNANTQPTTTPMTYFDFEGKVRIEVEMPGLPDKVESRRHSAVVGDYARSQGRQSFLHNYGAGAVHRCLQR